MTVSSIVPKSIDTELKKELKKIIINEKDSSEMILIPAGEFTMGSDEKHIFGIYADEKPVHKVFLDDYYIDKYEISAAQFAKFLNERGNPDNRYFNANPFATIIKEGEYI